MALIQVIYFAWHYYNLQGQLERKIHNINDLIGCNGVVNVIEISFF